MSQADLHPVSMEKVGTSGLRIIWSDGLSHEISWNLLRAKCPCASCREEKETPPKKIEIIFKSKPSRKIDPEAVLRLKLKLGLNASEKEVLA